MPNTIALANSALNLIFGGTAWSARPTTLYFALFTSMPTTVGGGTEVVGSAYARKAITANGTNFTAASAAGDNVPNAVDIQWARATGNWGTVVGWGIYDAATSGNLLWFESFSTSTDIVNGQQLKIASGALTFSFAGKFGNTIEKAFLNHFLTGASYSAISNHYFALGTGATSAGLTGEATVTNGYARKLMANNKTTYGSAADGSVANAVAIAFATATGSWASGATLTTFGIYDASTSGNLLWYGTIPGVAISAGTYQWGAGELNLGLVG